MHEIICPHFHKAFKIDEAGYADILKQVRDRHFENQLHERLELAEREKQGAIALAEANVTNALQKTAAAKDTEIQALKAQLDAGEGARKLAVTEALGTVSKERDQLANELEQTRNSSQAEGQRNGAATGRYRGHERGRGGGRPRSPPSSKKCTGWPGTSTRRENTQPESG